MKQNKAKDILMKIKNAEYIFLNYNNNNNTNNNNNNNGIIIFLLYSNNNLKHVFYYYIFFIFYLNFRPEMKREKGRNNK